MPGAPTLCKLPVPLLMLLQGVRGCASCLHMGAAPSSDWASHSVLGPASSEFFSKVQPLLLRATLFPTKGGGTLCGLSACVPMSLCSHVPMWCASASLCPCAHVPTSHVPTPLSLIHSREDCPSGRVVTLVCTGEPGVHKTRVEGTPAIGSIPPYDPHADDLYSLPLAPHPGSWGSWHVGRI